VLEVKTDRAPPPPPHRALDQAKKFSQSQGKGDARARRAVVGAARQLLRAVFPDRQD
jgi:hypothetical protein